MSNPFFAPSAPHGIPDFPNLRFEHYREAFDKGFAEQGEEIQRIVASAEAPTFENTLLALENSGATLRRVEDVFWNLTSSDTDEKLQALECEIAPESSAHRSAIYGNPKLFSRVQAVYDSEEELSPEQRQLLEETRQLFVRSGAALDEADRHRVSAITEKLAVLCTRFGQNVLADSNAYALVLTDEKDLAGLPAYVRDMGREEARSRGHLDAWVFTLSRSSITPFLQYADQRSLREAIYRGYTECGTRTVDNRPLIREIVALRQERAQLLGFESHADFMLDDRMARTTEAVRELLDQVWDPCQAQVAREATALLECSGLAAGEELAPWDWWYYTEKLRRQRFDLDPDELKQYFTLENVRDGVFAVANKLYGLVFKERRDLPVYHPDVVPYEVCEADGTRVGFFLFDFYSRPSKRSGAWMSEFRAQSYDGQRVTPVIVNCCNFPKSTPCLLGVDEVRTLFHEFGHGLHGLLSDVPYASLGGTNVKQDFVELPSQIMEHWAMEPQVLKSYARHVDSGEVIPDALIAKLKDSEQFKQGFATTEYLAACYLDLAWHSDPRAAEGDVEAFEAQAMAAIGKTPMIDPRYKSTYFQHIFSDDAYSAGYYVYIWAEVLDADGYEAFKENGLFDSNTARAFRSHVLERGGSADPMALYRAFRGRDPRVEPLLRNRGLL
ncbi:M3 family metallopeptidase [Congregibacter litoralis]|uniref:Putative peptidyl-dipeptidase n=1 Tax=Congregibacter litoralis KT71 TaxID=314285 RepID=A4A789_9GAMM|nr:M3 family metallopeptidase [Congregibacter litoralis]EAQ98158.1 putative peptidyl-dipeptidase [Congregibacter litoralis KT71]